MKPFHVDPTSYGRPRLPARLVTPAEQAVIDAARAWRANRQAGAYDLAATSAAAHALLRALDALDQQETK